MERNGHIRGPPTAQRVLGQGQILGPEHATPPFPPGLSLPQVRLFVRPVVLITSSLLSISCSLPAQTAAFDELEQHYKIASESAEGTCQTFRESLVGQILTRKP
jgi:hypothetical protein